MTYELFIADRLFSSWSLRGWLTFAGFGLDCDVRLVGLYQGTMAQDLLPVAPARLVPVLRLPDGTAVGESLAIAETVAEHFPNAGHWPADPAQRATARWLCAEMATGFGALRTDCPMQLLRCYRGFSPSEAVRADLVRIEALWTHARSLSGNRNGWLMGAYSLADVFYTPVAARIIGYGLPVSAASHAYCARLLGTDAVRAWRAKGMDAPRVSPEPYAIDLDANPWPD